MKNKVEETEADGKKYFHVEAIVELPEYPYVGMTEPINEDGAMEEIKAGLGAVYGDAVILLIRPATQKEIKEWMEVD